MQIIEMPPYAPTLMESTRAIGYSSEAAIADIIDNSIAANADNIDVDFFPGADAYISILDNGVGMDDGELQRAMQYGSKSPLDIRSSNDLGRYGLGMKTASLSQCRILSVISKKQDELVGCQWNLDIIAKEMKWSLVILDKTEILSLPNCDKLQLYKSGTLIVWQDLDKFSVGDANIADSFQRKMHPIEEHLALVFHRYLKGEQGIQKLNISINNVTLLILKIR